MLVVTVEIWPMGEREHARLIDQVFIHNDGIDNENVGRYVVRQLRADKRVVNLFHHRDKGALDLVAKALMRLEKVKPGETLTLEDR